MLLSLDNPATSCYVVWSQHEQFDKKLKYVSQYNTNKSCLLSLLKNLYHKMSGQENPRVQAAGEMSTAGGCGGGRRHCARGELLPLGEQCLLSLYFCCNREHNFRCICGVLPEECIVRHWPMENRHDYNYRSKCTLFSHVTLNAIPHLLMTVFIYSGSISESQRDTENIIFRLTVCHTLSITRTCIPVSALMCQI